MDTSQRWAKVGEQVTQRMLERGVTQADLVRLSKLSDATIRKVMNGEQGPDRDANLAKIALALGWTYDSLQAIAEGRKPTPNETTRQAIEHDPDLTEGQRKLLLEAYEAVLMKNGRPRSGTPRR